MGARGIAQWSCCTDAIRLVQQRTPVQSSIYIYLIIYPLEVDLLEVDLEKFRLNTNRLVSPKPKGATVRTHLAGKFLRGPVPLKWLHTAGTLAGRALHVAVELRFQCGVCRSEEVRFSYSSVLKFGVKRHAAYRGLRALETAGLVTVCRAPGRCPIVRILDGPA